MHISKLRNKFILVGLFTALPFVICIILAQISHFHEEVDEAIDRQQEVAEDIAQAYSSFVEEILVLERILGSKITSRSVTSPRELRQNLLDIAAYCSKIKHIAVFDPKGIVVASNTPQLEGLSILQLKLVNFANHTKRELQISGTLYLEPLKEDVFAISLPIQDSKGQLTYIISVFVDEQSVKQSVVGRMMNSSLIVITDSRGMVAIKGNSVRFLPSRQCLLRYPLIREALNGRLVTVEHFRMPSGPIVLGAVVPIREFNWTVGVFYPRELVVGPVRRKAVMLFILSMALVGAAIGITGYIGNVLSKPVLDLVEATRAFQAGDMSVRADVRTGDEIQILGQSFNDMAETLQKRTNELHESLESEKRRVDEVSTLYSIAQGLVVTTSLDERLEVIARSLASFCKVNRCVIFLRRGDRLVATAGWGLMHPESLQGIIIEIPESPRLEPESLRAGKPVMIDDISSWGILPAEFIKAVNVKGGLLLPLVRRNHVVGIAFLDNLGEVPVLEPEIIERSRELADLAAIAIEHAMAMKKQSNIAEALQSSMLPKIPANIGVFGFACRYYPALEEAELGGDFYDLVVLPDDKIGLVIADVAGKGLEAAVYTAMGKYTLRAFLSEEPVPSSALTRANNALVRTAQEWGFVTMFHGILNVKTGQLTYSNGGHPPAILVRKSGGIIMLPASERQPPLGIFGDIQYVDETTNVLPGDLLVLYTDGLIEARRDGEYFDIERLIQVVTIHRHENPNRIADAIYESIRSFCSGAFQDDIVFMVLRHEGD
ncbi:MAG: SpoIIE family protein phosphatase [Armatimonadota bacterium]|nr:SpoIIE family protein phosphatase [Armatimonadota bacterium]